MLWTLPRCEGGDMPKEVPDETSLTPSEQKKLEAFIECTVKRVLAKTLDQPTDKFDQRTPEFHDLAGLITLVFNQNLIRVREAVKSLGKNPFKLSRKEQTDYHLAAAERERKERRYEVTSKLHRARGRLSQLTRIINPMEAKLIPGINAKGIRDRHAEQLKHARVLLQQLRSKTLEELLRHPQGVHYDLHRAQYPQVPTENHIPPTQFGEGIPEIPGVYFLWDKGVVDYVGQSINLSNRLRLGSHHVMQPHHTITFIRAFAADLDWTESFYIGICRPDKNFGLHRAKHRKPIESVEPCPAHSNDVKTALPTVTEPVTESALTAVQ